MSLVQNAKVQQAVLTMLAALSSDGIRHYGMHEAPPFGDSDQTDDTPITRWCRLASLVLNKLPFRAAGDLAHYSFVATVTVGVSEAEHEANPRQVDDDAALVAAAMDAKVETVDDHRVVVHETNHNPLPETGQHPAHRLYAVTASGRVEITE
jgi:hypothetical protein